MSAPYGNLRPLMPRLDLPYFTLLPHFEGGARQCLYVTAAPPLNDASYRFERVAYGGLLRHLIDHPSLQPLWELGNTSPALNNFGGNRGHFLPSNI